MKGLTYTYPENDKLVGQGFRHEETDSLPMSGCNLSEIFPRGQATTIIKYQNLLLIHLFVTFSSRLTHKGISKSDLFQNLD